MDRNKSRRIFNNETTKNIKNGGKKKSGHHLIFNTPPDSV